MAWMGATKINEYYKETWMKLKIGDRVSLYGGKYGDDYFIVKGYLSQGKSLVFLRDNQGRTFVESVDNLSTSSQRQVIEKDN